MRLIDTKHSYLIIDKENDRVIKFFKTYWMRKCPWLIKNEVRALKRLNSKHFPKYITQDENTVTMEYAGKGLSQIQIRPVSEDAREFTEMPENFEEQVEEILNELETANLRHSDIDTGHFLNKEGVVMLIDFELCLEKDEPEPKGYPKTMGVGLKIRTLDEPINDRMMAKRTIENLKGGIIKIENLLKRLPNRKQYHELPFNIIQKVDRKSLKQRIEMMKKVYDFKGKKGLDLGCNLGGLTFSLAIEGAEMVGVEKNKPFVDIANACEDYHKLGCKFENADIVDYMHSSLEVEVVGVVVQFPQEHYDFCLLLAIWHWIVKQQGEKVGIEILKTISENCDVMFFEINFGHEEGINGSEETMTKIGLTNEQAVVDYIKKNTDYTEVKNIGKCMDWGNRITFMCSKNGNKTKQK